MHVIIGGTARSGKTTLSLMASKYGFVHYKMDSIKRGICEAYNLKYDEWESLSPIMCKIIDRMIKDNKTDTNFGKENYLFDIPFIYPKDLHLIDTSDTLVLFLGYSDITKEENFENIRNNDGDNLWTKQVDDETLMGWCEENVEFSKHLKEECKKYNIKYFDTSHNREQVLESALEYIKENTHK